jgi:glutamine amidotransferase
MCRWIAYRGETTALEHFVTTPAHSLISQSIQALESTASVNGDGFGLGWYGIHPEPGLYREIRPAWSDENLRHLCRHLQSHLFFAHVRPHPAELSSVRLQSRLRRQVEASDELYAARIGTTDSEAIFLAIMGAGIENPIAATERILARLTDFVNQNGDGDRLRFTAALSNGRDLYAFRYAVNDRANTLYYRESEQDIVIVSEPPDRDHRNWVSVPENRVLVAMLASGRAFCPSFISIRKPQSNKLSAVDSERSSPRGIVAWQDRRSA